MDWSMPDDWHSRGDASWIQAIYNDAGINEVVDGQLDPTGGLLFGSASTGRRAAQAVSLLQHGRRLSGKFMQLHHILPRYFRYIIDKSSNVGAMIPRNLHRDYHRHVDLGMRGRPLSAPPMNAGEKRWKAWIDERARRLYGGNTDMRRAAEMVGAEVKDSLQMLTDQWGSQNGISGLGAVLRNLLQ